MSLEPDNSPILVNPEESPSKYDSFDYNIYALTKTIAKGLLNVALLTDNAKQLKLTIELGPEKCEFYELILTLVIVSILIKGQWPTEARCAQWLETAFVLFHRHKSLSHELGSE